MNRTEKTISAYDNSAQQFADRFMDFETYKNKINYFQHNYLANGKSILDLGCGPGNNAKLFSEADGTYEITGIDLSEKMVDLAKTNVPKGNFTVCDIRDFRFNQSFDAVIASFCIVHLTHAEASSFIKNTCEHLKNGGYLYVSFMEGEGSGFESTGFSKNEIFFNYFNRSEIIEFLNHCSMEVTEIFEEMYIEKNGDKTKDIFIIARKLI